MRGDAEGCQVFEFLRTWGAAVLRPCTIVVVAAILGEVESKPAKTQSKRDSSAACARPFAGANGFKKNGRTSVGMTIITYGCHLFRKVSVSFVLKKTRFV
jgi:hypothetical protein